MLHVPIDKDSVPRADGCFSVLGFELPFARQNEYFLLPFMVVERSMTSRLNGEVDHHAVAGPIFRAYYNTDGDILCIWMSEIVFGYAIVMSDLHLRLPT